MVNSRHDTLDVDDVSQKSNHFILANYLPQDVHANNKSEHSL